VLALDVAMGIVLLALIGVVSAYRPVAVSAAARRAGWVLVAVPLPAAVSCHLFLFHRGPLDESLFLSGVLAFALGAVLVLGRDEDDDGAGDDGLDPRWWPEFERAFHDYVSGSRRQRVRA